MVDLIETIFGFMQPEPTVQVKDPDDYMGSTIWTSTELEAFFNTSGDGAYGFFFEVPYNNWVSCFGWEPCTQSISSPINMRVRVKFCLYREGIAEGDLKSLCSPYEDVRPYVK
jgi:hypothetical protein